MEESISGFKQRGDWGAVVEHGERITSALREAGASGEAFDAWNEWRPKSHERLDEDIEKKTAEQASVAEGKGEKAGKKPAEDLQTAGEKLSESYEQMGAGENGEAVERAQDSIDHVVRAADSAGRRAVRSVEDTVYRRVMTQLAPYYFDNELVSANIQKTTRGEDAPAFVFEVDINDDELKQQVSDHLASYEDEIDRWHVDTPKSVESAEAVEGAEPPPETIERPEETDNDASSTTN